MLSQYLAAYQSISHMRIGLLTYTLRHAVASIAYTITRPENAQKWAN